MPNENQGEIVCPVCKTEQHIRKNKNSKLYIHCERCGNLPLNTRDGQDWIRDNGNLYGAAAPKPTPPPAEKPAAPAAPKKKSAPVQPSDPPQAKEPAAEKPAKKGGLGIFG